MLLKKKLYSYTGKPLCLEESAKDQALIYKGEKSIVPFVNIIRRGKMYTAKSTKPGEKAL